MAANKRPRKKYSPKRSHLAACRYAHFIPKLAVSNEPLKDREVAEISAPYFAFIEALKAGTATEGMFYTACSTHYLYFALLKVFQADTFNADEDTEAAFRIGLAPVSLSTSLKPEGIPESPSLSFRALILSMASFTKELAVSKPSL